MPSNLQPNCGCYMGQCLLIDFTCGRTVVTVQVDRIIGVAKGRNRLTGLAAILGAVVRHEVDAIVVPSLHHLGFSVESLLETLAELHRHGVKLVVHDHADLVETGGLLAAADLLVEVRRAYRRENIVAGQLRAWASGVRFGRPPVPPSLLEAADTGRARRSTGTPYGFDGAIAPAEAVASQAPWHRSGTCAYFSIFRMSGATPTVTIHCQNSTRTRTTLAVQCRS